MTKTPTPGTESESFSSVLDEWLHSDKPKTIAAIADLFAEKSFALVFLILMVVPALPLPTGGATHLFEIITMLLALELIAQKSTIWLPSRWRHKKLGKKMQNKALPVLVKFIRAVEKVSRPRAKGFMKSAQFKAIFGLITFVLTLAAFLSPPFSGLDTIPSMGVVVISLGVILDDLLLVILGTILGSLGIGVSAFFGNEVVQLIGRLL